MLDVIDQALLAMLQENFPIAHRPYKVLGERLNMPEDEVLNRVRTLKEHGYIRRIGGTFDSKKLGYVSTLCALKVPQDRITEVASIINCYPGVTHNYIRDHSYNMWFTLTASSKAQIQDILNQIRLTIKLEDLMELPAVKMFKIKTCFDMREG